MQMIESQSAHGCHDVAGALRGHSVPEISLFGYDVALKYVLIPTIGLVVVVYGIAGGLAAAYYTDLLQGVCIIVLSVMLMKP